MTRAERYEWRVRWKRDARPCVTDPQTATFQTEAGARAHWLKIGPEPWKAWGCEPDDPFHDKECSGRYLDHETDPLEEPCPGCSEDNPRTWRDAYRGHRSPIYRELVRRPVGEWESVEREESGPWTCACGRVDPTYTPSPFDAEGFCEECGHGLLDEIDRREEGAA